MLTISLIVFGLILVAAAANLIRITKIERAYREMFQQDDTIPTWQRKRWAFTLLVGAHVLGFSRLIWVWEYTSLVYLLMVCVAFWLFFWAYGSFLKDIKTLPSAKQLAKADHGEVMQKLNRIGAKVQAGADTSKRIETANQGVAVDLAAAHKRADESAGEPGAAADAAVLKEK